MAQVEKLPKEEAKDRIVEGLSEGIPLRELCREPGMPAWRTVYDWLAAEEDFAARFQRARDLGFDAIAEEALEIADDGTNDWTTRRTKKGGVETVINNEHVQRSRLRIDTRLKLLAKWSPKKYGERTQLEHTGADGGAIEVAHANVADIAKQLREAMAGRIQQAEPAKALPASDGKDLL